MIMKKVLFILIMAMSVLAVNGQTAKTQGTKAKATHNVVKVTDLQKSITDNIAKRLSRLYSKGSLGSNS